MNIYFILFTLYKKHKGFLNTSITKRSRLDDFLKIADNSNSCFNEMISCTKDIDSKYLLSDQSDNNKQTKHMASIILTNKHIEYVASKASSHWKPIAREIKFNESQILEIEKNSNHLNLNEKLYHVLKLWISKAANNNENYFTLDKLLKILTACRLNKVKGGKNEINYLNL